MKNRTTIREELKNRFRDETYESLVGGKRRSKSVEEAFEAALDRMVDSLKPKEFKAYEEPRESENEWI